jgi:hypothetical protein
LPESYWDPATNAPKPEFGTHYTELATRDAQATILKSQALQRVEDVKLDLPKDFVVPQGVEFQWNAQDPGLQAFKELAVKEGMSQATVTKLLGSYAASKLAEQQATQTAVRAEAAKLGVNATARITAITTWANGFLGEKQGGAIIRCLALADAVEGFERIAAAMTTQGTAPFSQAHRTPLENNGPGPQRVSEEEYQKMTPGERFTYARQFDQKQFYDPNKVNGR